MSEISDDFFDDIEEDDNLPADLESSEDLSGDGRLTPKGGTSKEVRDSIWRVYHELGGDEWLLKQAKAYPKEFLQIIKQMLPKDADKNAPAKIAILLQQADGEQIRGASSAVDIIGQPQEPVEIDGDTVTISTNS